MEALGDLAVIAPDVAAAAVETRLNQFKNLSLRAPVFVWNALGEPRPVGAQALRQFREYEDATWNLQGLLDRVAAGSLTRTQAEALREQYPEVHSVLVQQVFEDKGWMQKATRERIAAVERLTGIPMSRATPDYAQRQQVIYQPPQQTQPAPTQNLNIQAPPPTPAQATMAPGNR